MDKKFLKTLNVLYVEDEENIRELTKSIFETIFKKVFVASNGKKGVAIYRKY